MTIEIYWDDLSVTKKLELLRIFGSNHNWDTCPIAVVEIEEDDEDD